MRLREDGAPISRCDGNCLMRLRVLLTTSSLTRQTMPVSLLPPPPVDIDELMKLPAESFGTPRDWVPFIGLGRLCEEDMENVGGGGSRWTSVQLMIKHRRTLLLWRNVGIFRHCVHMQLWTLTASPKYLPNGSTMWPMGLLWERVGLRSTCRTSIPTVSAADLSLSVAHRSPT